MKSLLSSFFVAPSLIWNNCQSLGNCVSLQHLLFPSTSMELPLYLSICKHHGVFMQGVSSLPGSGTLVQKKLSTQCINDSLGEWINPTCYLYNDLIDVTFLLGYPQKFCSNMLYVLFFFSHCFIVSKTYKDNWHIYSEKKKLTIPIYKDSIIRRKCGYD